jgi:hypothetical protein
MSHVETRAGFEENAGYNAYIHERHEIGSTVRVT